MKRIKLFVLCIFFSVLFMLLGGCGSHHQNPSKCTVLFEDNSSLYFPNQVHEVTPSDNLVLTIGVPRGERIASINYEDYSVSSKTGETLSFDYYELTLNHVMYSMVVRITTAPAYTTVYHINEVEQTLSTESTILITEESPHLYFNTLPFQEEYLREGYLPIGWNTSSDGSGVSIGFGSRFDHRNVPQVDLYLEWLACSSPEEFQFTLSRNNEITITGYVGREGRVIDETTICSVDQLVIPAYINGYPVTSIASGTFGNLNVTTLVLPPTLQSISDKAFGDLTVHDLYFYDNLSSVSEASFHSYQITTLHINAILAPVYSGSYFDTLSDKVDYLSSIRDQKKLVLFCGSSARFGYDSSKIEAAFPDYKVANMGVYAYSNMLPQAEILVTFLKEGDIVLSSPEFDAIDMQFCSSTAFDKETYCMMESNYDMLTLLDATRFTNIFSAFQEYNKIRQDMTPRSYLESASHYDEDGKLQSTSSYNSYGDYIVFRGNNESRKTFGIKRAFYHPDHFDNQAITSLNDVYDSFNAKGACVFFTYSPRSNISLSSDSTTESIHALDQLLRNRLHATFISSIDSSLMDPLYFYGTDNHLSTEGVSLFTTKIINDLRIILEDQL